MKKECIILCDTNICIYRTLALIKPEIYREELENVTIKINNLSNNNFRCEFIISDLIISELKDNGILFWEINNFCFTKLHLTKSYRILKIFNEAKKSMGKFISKFEMKPELREKIKEYSLNINSIEQFYLRFPAKLRELTDSKTRNMNPKQKQDKLNQRPNNLPEETDIKLFAQAIEFDKIHHSDVYIFSNDGDFTEFIDEIPSEFKIKILRIEDIIPSYATE